MESRLPGASGSGGKRSQAARRRLSTHSHVLPAARRLLDGRGSRAGGRCSRQGRPGLAHGRFACEGGPSSVRHPAAACAWTPVAPPRMKAGCLQHPTSAVDVPAMPGADRCAKFSGVVMRAQHRKLPAHAADVALSRRKVLPDGSWPTEPHRRHCAFAGRFAARPLGTGVPARTRADPRCQGGQRLEREQGGADPHGDGWSEVVGHRVVRDQRRGGISQPRQRFGSARDNVIAV